MQKDSTVQQRSKESTKYKRIHQFSKNIAEFRNSKLPIEIKSLQEL